MASEGNNLSEITSSDLSINCSDYKIAIVVSSWNQEITENLLSGSISTLEKLGVQKNNILVKWVPGAFELPLGCQLISSKNDIDGLIVIGVVIQGATKHFDYVCSGTTQGIMSLMLKINKPISFCVLTDNNIQQSIERSGGKHGNKGVEAAVACLRMIELKKSL